ncbi:MULTISPECIES: aminotransferase class I/II-fold pyridoxal phosphate-dependent enzyme [Dickeya]|uniref:Aminotransferase n=1 Tax=Dickeya fangzhongdai TaxID=1778540 RepID=A0A2K8QN01_9GAMM|nr:MULTISPECIES: aminotransferase class I/II-fold pyridoxal phosphate-dependent enzyme [Dickeya]ATZ94881.1 aminotransferase [Dickeya fangzhongdai]MBO8134682.1 aminotransferase class I/II-fold pyridoxal phosphate-dependent enzyme [Dickeya fangzhongdai]QOH48322.1 aminotransferase class I/II-fold pyridoxal phosphate-dependent enzyme [Dickeya fangzhongdai]QOH52625.1 aminotransferase class I/II-fold pyridoxal phosphate-dependent enzyme [Dickeya fangzhongdai]UGA49499.1 aminotransferase class I/II-fo
MDFHDLVELERKPFKERVKLRYGTYLKEVEKGFMFSRQGMGPVDAQMQYKDLHSDDFRNVLVFGSNSYLGLANHPYVKSQVVEAVEKYGIGTGGSPAFSGYTKQHRDLELRLAALAGHEDAVLLPSGYMANLCWVNGLMNRNDIIIYDQNSHASVINAVKMTNVPFFTFDPERLDEFEAMLPKIRARSKPNAQIFSTVEGVRSTDGSIIDLKRYIEICRAHDIIIILDDAHGLGTMGRTGKGTLEHLDLLGQVDLRMSTCSKSLGAQGAFISGSREHIFMLRNFSYPYLFTSGLAQPTIAAISAALDVMEREPERIARLHDNVRYMQDLLEAKGFNILRGESGIIPVFFSKLSVVGNINRRLFERGVFANIMEYPMVPPDKERLRISVMSTHTREEIEQVVELITEVAREFDAL